MQRKYVVLWEEYLGNAGRSFVNWAFDSLCGKPITIAVKNAYEYMGLFTGATLVEVKKAYKQKVLQVHPDKDGDEDEFIKLATAYGVLLQHLK